MWFVFQQLSRVPLDYCHAAGTVIPPGENGFITFRRLWTASFVGPGPLTCPNLTATIAWRLNSNNAPAAKLTVQITAAGHKPARPGFHSCTTGTGT